MESDCVYMNCLHFGLNWFPRLIDCVCPGYDKMWTNPRTHVRPSSLLGGWTWDFVTHGPRWEPNSSPNFVVPSLVPCFFKCFFEEDDNCGNFQCVSQTLSLSLDSTQEALAFCSIRVFCFASSSGMSASMAADSSPEALSSCKCKCITSCKCGWYVFLLSRFPDSKRIRVFLMKESHKAKKSRSSTFSRIRLWDIWGEVIEGALVL